MKPLPRAALANSAEQFRTRYALGARGALELEPIIEFGLRIELRPIKKLIENFGKYGWLTMDGRSILYDAEFADNHPEDFRSFLGHEIGHTVHHSRLLPTQPVTERADFVAFHAAFGQVANSNMEWEAREFGMALQMPAGELERAFVAAVEQAKDLFPDLFGPAKLFVTTLIAGYFGVSLLRAEVRIADEKLWRRIRKSVPLEWQRSGYSGGELAG